MDRVSRLLSLLVLIDFLACRSQSSDSCSAGDIRLVGGSSYKEGRVEVCAGGQWGTVCDDEWDQPDARVACRKLGLSDRGAVALTGNDIDRFGIGTGPIHLDDLDCSGDETDLFKCPRRSDCLHSEDASVVCPADDEVVLVQEGRLVPNNSLLLLESLGDRNESSAGPLRCVTTDPFCCLTNLSGSWFAPGSTVPLSSEEGMSGLFQSWSDEQSVELHRPGEVSVAETGLYRCEAPDAEGVMQTMYAGVYSSESEGSLTVTDLSYDTSSSTFTCTSSGGPATSVSWRRDGSLLAVDGTTFEATQVVTDTSTATYENRLTIVGKSEDLSGTYSCTVGNAAGSDSAQITQTVCVDRSARLNEATRPPTLDLCSSDTWLPLEGNYQSPSSQDLIRNLRGIQMGVNAVSLTWNAQDSDSIARYDVTCSSERQSSTSHNDNGRIEAAILTDIAPGSYQCCVRAYLDVALFGLVDMTSTECVGVSVNSAGVSGGAVGGSGGVAGLSTVTYALAGLVGLLLVVTIVIAVGCVCIVLSKRRHQLVTHPRRRHSKHITTTSSFLVDNPIYKSTSSLTGTENTNHTSLPLRAMGSESSVRSSPVHTHIEKSADNPQYGSIPQAPPPQEAAPRYIKVGSDNKEPMYELIKGAQQPNGTASASCIDGKPPDAGPIYSTPIPLKRESTKKRSQGLPLYDTTMEIPAPTGKDGLYSKLSHE